MKNLARVSVIVVTALFLMSVVPNVSFSQCILNCPAGDGGVVGPGAGNKSPDLNGDGIVNLIDLAIFAAAWPPGAYDFCPIACGPPYYRNTSRNGPSNTFVAGIVWGKLRLQIFL